MDGLHYEYSYASALRTFTYESMLSAWLYTLPLLLPSPVGYLVPYLMPVRIRRVQHLFQLYLTPLLKCLLTTSANLFIDLVPHQPIYPIPTHPHLYHLMNCLLSTAGIWEDHYFTFTLTLLCLQPRNMKSIGHTNC